MPQCAMVSANRGHHWILEKNEVRWANACGIDVGNQDWKAAKPAECGRHILRGNRVSDCGVCGIAGCTVLTRRSSRTILSSASAAWTSSGCGKSPG